MNEQLSFNFDYFTPQRSEIKTTRHPRKPRELREQQRDDHPITPSSAKENETCGKTAEAEYAERRLDVNGGIISRGDRHQAIGRPKSAYDLVIATDGSCSGNPGPGGWAWVEQLTGRTASGGATRTTNNIMELTAMIEALTFAGSEASLLIRADSSYVINSMTKWAPGWRKRGWKKSDGKPVQNRELIEQLLNLYEGRKGKTDIEWVRGHNGDAGNELADSLAVDQTRRHS